MGVVSYVVSVALPVCRLPAMQVEVPQLWHTNVRRASGVVVENAGSCRSCFHSSHDGLPSCCIHGLVPSNISILSQLSVRQHTRQWLCCLPLCRIPARQALHQRHARQQPQTHACKSVRVRLDQLTCQDAALSVGWETPSKAPLAGHQTASQPC